MIGISLVFEEEHWPQHHSAHCCGLAEQTARGECAVRFVGTLQFRVSVGALLTSTKPANVTTNKIYVIAARPPFLRCTWLLLLKETSVSISALSTCMVLHLFSGIWRRKNAKRSIMTEFSFKIDTIWYA
jgi:hypothetical protein